MGETNEAIEWLARDQTPTAATYWQLANNMLRENIDPKKMVPVAGKALRLFEEHPPVERPPYATYQDWEKLEGVFLQRKIGFPTSYVYHTYATALYRDNKIEPALTSITRAYEITEGKSPGTNTRYVEIRHA